MEHERKSIQVPENVPIDPVFEAMLKDHLRNLKRDGIIEEIRSRQYYIKPSEKRRLREKEIQRLKRK